MFKKKKDVNIIRLNFEIDPNTKGSENTPYLSKYSVLVKIGFNNVETLTKKKKKNEAITYKNSETHPIQKASKKISLHSNSLSLQKENKPALNWKKYQQYFYDK